MIFLGSRTIERKKMKNCKNSKLYFLILAMCSLSIALIFISGIVLKMDLVGRILIGSLWLVVSIGWLSNFFYRKYNEKHSEESDCAKA
jgi:hypothetical protein